MKFSLLKMISLVIIVMITTYFPKYIDEWYWTNSSSQWLAQLISLRKIPASRRRTVRWMHCTRSYLSICNAYNFRLFWWNYIEASMRMNNSHMFHLNSRLATTLFEKKSILRSIFCNWISYNCITQNVQRFFLS